ncbi:peptide transporter [Aureobasidium pullulans]|uniref:Peptide transporter n=1 Tax=Aureobasidium pullulans TaxID=5580 RepID=A0A4S9CJH8_AURPU|nr:peptide transporter [Aureobasidium pullulans]
MSHAMEVPNGLTPVEPFTGNAESITTGDLVSDYATIPAYTKEAEKKAALDTEITAVPTLDSTSDDFEKTDNSDHIIITGADAAAHLLPLSDDGDASVTFRGIFLASCLSAFQAVMNQIYTFKPTSITLQGTFIVLIAYFVGNAWAKFLPRGDRHRTRWRANNGDNKPPFWIYFLVFINPGPWGLKEHAICSITATSASNAAAVSLVFAAQEVFYDLPISPATVILTMISIGLFGYGLCGLLRPIAVWHVEAVYWSTLPTVKTLQGSEELKATAILLVHLVGMFFYEFFPAYIFPWLNSVSIPCLASMKATGEKAAILTNLFGGATNNEGLGLFTVSFDWQYITSFNTSLPLILQGHVAIGVSVCMIVMLIIYYTDTWGSKSQPSMSTQLRSQDGKVYPISKVFVGGVLDEEALQKYGIPRLTGTFAYAMFMANAAIGALIAHTILFRGGDIKRTYKSAREGRYDDRHHQHMAKNYKEVPWWWYMAMLVFSFVLGLIVVIKENITMPVWAYVVALISGIIVAPFSALIYSRFGNGIATNNLSKMIAGSALPGRPVGNMYFAAWSHNVITNTVNLCNDLKMGEYLKIPSRVMFVTQIYGTILGGFLNYAVMIYIVSGNAELLTNGNGNASWSGATIQSYNTNASSWALAKYLHKTGTTYSAVPIGVAVGAGLVVVHRIFVQFVPKIRKFSTYDINMPQFIAYAGYIPYNQSQTCVIFSQLIAGFFTQFYLRNYRPRIFKDYSYLLTGAMDGASLLALFILSFAVFGAAGSSKPFPSWWGNNSNGNYDLCPVPE